MIRTILIVFALCCVSRLHSQQTLILQPGPEGKDANLWTIYPDNNYGNSQKFACMAWTHSGVPGKSRSIIDFDFSGLPENAYIMDARLNLYFVCLEPTYFGHTGDNASYLQLITSPWEEFTVTWNTQPSTTTLDQAYLPQSTSPYQDYTDIDVTAAVRRLFEEPESYFGLMLRLINENPYNCLLFASSDYMDTVEMRPRLVITYLECLPPVVNFEYSADSLTVSFNGYSPSAITWHWDFGDGDTSNIQNPIHAYQEQGIYEVCLVVEDTCYYAEYCETLDMCTGPPEAAFAYTTDELDVFFQDSSSVASDYFWDFGDGYFSNLSNPWHAYELPGEYLVCQYVWNSCGSDTACQIIDICANPVSDFSYDIDGLTVYFEDNSSEADEYYWDFGDGYFSNLPNPFHIYDEIGDYQVCLMTWNECGSDTLCELVFLSTVTGAEENENCRLLIYPNPASDRLMVSTDKNGPARVWVYDLAGQVLFFEDVEMVSDETYSVDLKGYCAGIYVLRIAYPDTIINRKFAVR